MTARHRDLGGADAPGPEPAAEPGVRRVGPRRTVRFRLLLILAVPTGALVVLASLGVLTQLQVYRQAERTVESVQLTLVSQDFIHELQRERGLTNGLLGGEASYRTTVDEQRVRVDAARQALNDAVRTSSAELVTPVRGALDRLADLGDVRAEVDAGLADRARTLEFFTTAIAQLAQAGAEHPAELADPALLAGLGTLTHLGDAKEATALQRGFLNGVFSAGSFRDREFVGFTEIRARKLAAFDAYARDATANQQATLDAALRSPAATEARGYEQRALDGATAPALGVPAPAWWDTMTTLVDELRDVQRVVGSDVTARAAQLRATALVLLLVDVALAVAALAVAAGLGVVAARSITRPVLQLADEARRTATTRLPDTVARIQAAGVDTAPRTPPALAELTERDDEFAEVARALAQVERTAVRLATEQAVLRRNAAESMSNLARRNQNLLRRQLAFISELEREEDDPKILANLFELDHLATRMRRNAESLLVLVGERSPRQWSRPVPMYDVVRAALSEVEDYRRVTLRRVDATLVAGAAGAELAHLLAELVENALSFSPPDCEVEVHGQETGNGYVLAILDNGIGMSAEELERANARLRGAETFLVAPTRYLGHYVVGQLAARLGVDVTLHESPVTGIVARVTLPPSLLEQADPPADLFLPPGPPVPSPRPTAEQGVRSRPVAAPGGGGAVAVLVPPPGGTPKRTRNGLVKRVRGASVVEQDPATQARPAPEPPALDVRATLTSFRHGVRRAAEEHRTAPEPEELR